MRGQPSHTFSNPYTKIQFVEDELGVSRITAAKYLDQLADGGVLRKVKAGRSHLYINVRLYAILPGDCKLNASSRKSLEPTRAAIYAPDRHPSGDARAVKS